MNEILQDVDGRGSSKRVGAFIALGCLVVGFVADTFFGHHPSEYLMNDFMIVVLSGLGLAVVERFAPKAAA